MRLPDFLVLGAARSATTSLHYYLDQHPRITMSSIKEPNFFAHDHGVEPPAPLFDPTSAIATKSVTDLAAYAALFDHAPADAVLGEASPLYLYVREAPEQIARVLPAPRLLAVLRNPVDRAYSHWLHINRLPADEAVAGFRAACAAEMAHGPAYTPYASGTHVLRMGRYDDQLDRYIARFGREALLVLDYDQVVSRPQDALDSVCDHIGVERHRFDTAVQYNRSGVARGRMAAASAAALRAAQPRVKAALPPSLVRRLGRMRATYDRPLGAPELPADLRAEVGEWFAPSVRRLVDQGLIGPDLWPDLA